MISRQGDELFGQCEKPSVLNVGLRVLRMAGLGVSVVLLATTVRALAPSGETTAFMLTSPIVSGSMSVDSFEFIFMCHRNASPVPWALNSYTDESTHNSFIDELEELTPEEIDETLQNGGFLQRMPGAAVLVYPNVVGHIYIFCFRHAFVALFCSLIPAWYVSRWSRSAWRNRGSMPATVGPGSVDQSCVCEGEAPAEPNATEKARLSGSFVLPGTPHFQTSPQSLATSAVPEADQPVGSDHDE